MPRTLTTLLEMKSIPGSTYEHKTNEDWRRFYKQESLDRIEPYKELFGKAWIEVPILGITEEIKQKVTALIATRPDLYKPAESKKETNNGWLNYFESLRDTFARNIVNCFLNKTNKKAKPDRFAITCALCGEPTGGRVVIPIENLRERLAEQQKS